MTRRPPDVCITSIGAEAASKASAIESAHQHVDEMANRRVIGLCRAACDNAADEQLAAQRNEATFHMEKSA